MPAGRAIVHRTAAASGPAMPAWPAATSHGNGCRATCCRLVERRHRHGLRSRHRRESDADREQRSSEYLHWHSFLLVRDENDLAKTGSQLAICERWNPGAISKYWCPERLDSDVALMRPPAKPKKTSESPRWINSPMVMMAPVPVVPTMMPAVVAPVTVVPMAVVPMMMMPTHLHGLQLVDFLLRNDRRHDIRRCRHGRCLSRDRRHRSSLCAGPKHDRPQDQPSTEIQEIPKFHHFKSLSQDERTPAVSPSQYECSLNSSTRGPADVQNGSSVRRRFSQTRDLR